jgi:hypothetical protein
MLNDSAELLFTEGYRIVTMWRSDATTGGLAINQSIRKIIADSGVIRHKCNGPMLAIRELADGSFEDIESADLRLIIDFMISFGNGGVRELVSVEMPRAANTIKGVKICCNGEQRLRGSLAYIEIEVHAMHPTRWGIKEGRVAHVSEHLGMPIRLWHDPDDEAEEDWENQPGMSGSHEDNGTNEDAFWLLTDLAGPRMGWATFNWNDTCDNIGNVSAVRDDGADLEVSQLRAMCNFTRKKLVLMVELALEDDFATQSKQSILDSITWENVELSMQEAAREKDDSSSSAEDGS